ncbi:hypothetical protein [Clostridium sp. LP20]|uniref:hypothetical protein n=1 Tax=Clostridium sp. LP20 TaxID=3418665 RepID=UPI003EE7ECAE
MGYLEDQTSKVNSQYDSELASRIQAINKAKEQSVLGLNNQYDTQAKEYKNQRITADTQSAMSKKNNNELMAAIGAYNSGDNITANSRIDNNRASAIKAIMGAQNDYRKMTDEKINEANSNAQYQINDTTNSINSQRAQALRAVQEAERQRQFQEQMQREQIAAQERAAAASRAAAAQKAAASSSKSSGGTFNDFYAQFKDSTRSGSKGQDEARNMLSQGKDSLVSKYGYANYKKLYNWYWSGQAPENSYSSMKDSDLIDFNIS